jgi:hypothetical protein
LRKTFGQEFVESFDRVGVILVKKLAQFVIYHEFVVVLLHYDVKLLVSLLASKPQSCGTNLRCSPFCCLTPIAAKNMVEKMMFQNS